MLPLPGTTQKYISFLFLSFIYSFIFIVFILVCQPKISDVVIAMDTSGSVGHDAFAKLKSFLKRLVARLSISGRGTHVVVLGFDDVSHLSAPDFASAAARSLQGVRAQIDKVPFTQGSTLIQDALHEVRKLFSSRGARSQVRRAAIFLTDGQNFDGSNPLQEPARKLRQVGFLSPLFCAGWARINLQF